MFKKVNVLCFIFCLFTLSCCGSKVTSKRITEEESNKQALKMTDNWVSSDSEIAIDGVLKKIYASKSFQRYMVKQGGKQPKIFIAELQNNTSEPYLPIQDLNDRLLTKLIDSGDFILIDEAGRDKILNEIKYQNDGMVSSLEAKNIGNQAGADLMIFGNVNMKPIMSDGKTLKEYSINIRITEVSTGIEIVRARYEIKKLSERKGYTW